MPVSTRRIASVAIFAATVFGLLAVLHRRKDVDARQPSTLPAPPARPPALQPNGQSASSASARPRRTWTLATRTRGADGHGQAVVSHDSIVELRALKAGDLVEVPLFEGTVMARIQMARNEPSGSFVVGGAIIGGATGDLSLVQSPAGLRGTIILPDRKIAYTLAPLDATHPQGNLALTEKPLSDVICAPYPTSERDVPLLGDATNGADTSPIAVSVPVLSSRPAATAVLYIDMDGETVTDPSWNGGQTIVAKPPKLTADEMVLIWKRVSEDYAAFDIDITTDVARYNNASVGHRMRCIVTPTNTAAPGSGGVAYIGSFTEAGKSFSDTIPCWVFNPGVIGVSEAVSHELGHTLGLRHDGRTSPSEEYYFGQGDGPLSWAPIMGVGYYKNVVQWSKGEYANANNHEDDIAVIAGPINGFGYSADEAGDTPATSAPVTAGAIGDVSFSGVIQSATDTDLYSFTSPAGLVKLHVSPAEVSPDLDAVIQLETADGTVLAKENAALALDAAISYTLSSAGTYYIRILGTGYGDPLVDGYSSYGSIGRYSVTGAVPVGDGLPFVPPNVTVSAPRSITFQYQVPAANAPTGYTGTGLPAGLTIDNNTGIISGTPNAPEGSYTVSVTVSNSLGSHTGTLVIVLTQEPPPTVTTDPLRLVRQGEPFTIPLSATALPHAYAATGLPSGVNIDPSTGIISGTAAQTGKFTITVTATNGAGSGTATLTLLVESASPRISVSDFDAVLVGADGQLWGMGANGSSQLTASALGKVPIALSIDTNVVGATTGGAYTLWLKNDGTLWGRGASNMGALGTLGLLSSPTQIASNVRSFAAGTGHSVWVDSTGAAWTAGANDHGQLGDGTRNSSSTPRQLATNVMFVAAAGSSTFLIKSDRTLWALGDNSFGQLGDGTTADKSTPVEIAENVFAVSAANAQTVFLKSDGELWGMGNGSTGCFGNRSGNQATPIKLAEGITAACATVMESVFLKSDGSLWRLGSDGFVNVSTPVQVASNVTDFGAGGGAIVFTDGDGRVWGLGDNTSRTLGDGAADVQPQPIKVATGVTRAAAGDSHLLFIDENHALWGAGLNSSGELGLGDQKPHGIPVRLHEGVTAISAATGQSLFIDRDGVAWGMGWLIDNMNRAFATKMDSDVSAVAAGPGTSYLVQTNGLLWAIGQNDHGQLGDGTTKARASEVYVAANVTGVVATAAHALYWTANGSLYGMGNNTNGELGQADLRDYPTPVLIGSHVAKAATAYTHSFYISDTGDLYAMGDNDDGKLGDGTTTRQLAPIRVASNVTDVATNDIATYFITTDGALWACGRGYAAAPRRIAHGVAMITAAAHHASFIKKDGSLWGVGSDEFGQLGDGVRLYYDQPVEIVLGRPFVTPSSSTAEAAPGDNATLSVTAVGGGTLQYQWRKDGNAISGATTSSYTISNATAASAGTYDVVVTNGVGSVTSGTMPLTILNSAPQMVAASATARQGVGFRFEIAAENDPISFSATGLPTGLNVDPQTGVISGTTNAAAGIYSVTIGATNSFGSDSATFTLTVAAPLAPQITSSQTLVARRGLATAFPVSASTIAQSYSAVGLPAGLTIDAASGLISGTTTATPGIYSATISAANAGGSGSQTLRVAVLNEWAGRVSGYDTTLVIDADRKLWCAGNNAQGQLGDGTTINRGTEIAAATDVVTVFGSLTNSYFIKSDGSLWGMGWNLHGELGTGDTTERNSPVHIDNDVVGVAGGFDHVLYVKIDGSAWACGLNSSGQLGDGSLIDTSRPKQISSNVSVVGAGALHSALVKQDGTLWTFGDNTYGQLADGTTDSRSSPALVATNVSVVGGNLLDTVFLKTDGTLWGAGANGGRMLIDDTTTVQPTPVKVAENVMAYSTGANNIVFTSSDRTLWGKGIDWWAQLGDQSQQFVTATHQIGSDVVACLVGFSHSVFVKSDGTIGVFGTNTYGQIADATNPIEYIPAPAAHRVATASAGMLHTVYVTTNGELWAMGNNDLGALGDGTHDNRILPTKVMTDVLTAATGYWHTGIIKKDHSLWTTGNNMDGQLGAGRVDVAGVSTPTHVMDDVQSVATGGWHTVVLKQDGTVWAMGANVDGQLGTGDGLSHAAAVQVMSDVKEIAAGYRHTLYLKNDGTLLASGDNEANQLGDGTTTNQLTPVPIATGVAHIAAGAFHSAFAKSDGTLWTMGFNGSGQLGNGTRDQQSRPVQIDNDVVSVSAGSNHTVYVKQDGTVWAMGDNSAGQLGAGATMGSAATGAFAAPASRALVDFISPDRAASFGPTFAASKRALLPSSSLTAPSPAREPRFAARAISLTPPPYLLRPAKVGIGIAAASAGGAHTTFLRHDGSLWCAGYALYGRLGSGGGTVYWDAGSVKLGLPSIQGQSLPTGIRLGETVALSVSAVSDTPATYQWYRDGVPILDATTSQYVIAGASSADGGIYDIAVTNPRGTAHPTPVYTTVMNGLPVFGAPLSIDVPRLADPISVQLHANNDPSSYAASGLPTGLTLDPSTGVLSGTTNDPEGTVSATVTATNANGTGSATLVVHIVPQPAPTIVGAATVLAREGQVFHYAVQATNSPAGYAASGLPAGLSIDAATGVISGTVTAGAGQIVATVSANNASGTGTGSLTFIVLPVAAGLSATRSDTYIVDSKGRLWTMGGANDIGQLGDGSRAPRSAPQAVATDVVAVSASDSTLFYLTSDGTLWGCGSNQLVDSQNTTTGVISPRAIATRVRAVACGWLHVAYIDWDDNLWARGDNTWGQLGDGTTNEHQTSIRIASNVAEVAAGFFHTAFVKRDGTLWTVGRNELSELGDGTTTDRYTPLQLSTNVRSVSAGYGNTMYICNDDTLWGVGSVETGFSASTPTQLQSNVRQVASSYAAVYVTLDGDLWSVGSFLTLGSGTQHQLSGVKAAVTSGVHIVALTNGGTIVAAGDNGMGQLGVSPIAYSYPQRIADDVQSVSTSGLHTLYVKDSGELWSFGEPWSGQRGPNVNSYDAAAVAVSNSVIGVATLPYASLVLDRDQVLWGMGYNTVGALGTSSLGSNVTAPITIATDVRSFAAGSDFSLYINSDHSLWGVGANFSGQLGDPTRTNHSIAVKIADNAVAAAGGNAHTLYLTTSGDLFGVGASDSGQLGVSSQYVTSPRLIASGVTSIAAGTYHSLFVKDHVLWGTGANFAGQFGEITSLSEYSPVVLASSVESCAAGGTGTAFIKSDGTLWRAGANESGQIGDGTYVVPTEPVLVGTAVLSVSVSDSATCFVKRDHSLWVMGNNTRGRLGVSIIPSRATFAELALGSPGITALHIPAVANAGGTAQLHVDVKDDGPLTYQWRRYGAAIPGATGAALYIPLVAAADGGVYDVVVTGPHGSSTSESALMTVLNAPPVVTSPLTIATAANQPVDYRIRANNDAYIFSATGLPSGLTLDSTTGHITGTPAASNVVRTAAITAENDFGPTQATLEFDPPPAAPSIAVAPADLAVNASTNATFSVTADGFPVPALRWQVSSDGSTWNDLADGGVYSGVTTNTLSLTSVPPALNGARYRCVAANAQGSATSPAATLTVNSSAPSFSQQPTNRAVHAGDGATFSVAASGIPAPTFQWQSSVDGSNWSNVADGSGFSGVTTTSLTIASAALSQDGLLLRCVASNVVSSTNSSAASLSVTPPPVAPSFSTQPVDRTVNVGTSTTFAVTASGYPTPTYQWQVSTDGTTWTNVSDSGPYAGSATATLTITNATASMSGYKYRAYVSNSAGNVYTDVVTLTVYIPVSGTAAHQVSVAYTGTSITIANSLTYAGNVTQISWQVLLPDGWSYSADTANADVAPGANATGLVEWTWNSNSHALPTSPISFTYVLTAPTAVSTSADIVATVVLDGAEHAQTMGTPDPLFISSAHYHSADTDANGRISLLELTRVIELYNTRNGTTRTGCYQVQLGTEDGFAADSTRASTATITLAQYHSADTNRDGKISLLELTRVIELYNYRSGTNRTGQYHLSATATEDGFAPGP